jgi:hypothetical protein
MSSKCPQANLWRSHSHVDARGRCFCKRISPELAFARGAADIDHGRLAVDEPLANRVRSGRKQP